MKASLVISAFLSLALSAAAWAASPVPAIIAAAVADPGRPQADRDKDASRDPAALLTFMDVKPGDTVVDFFPGSGYWTRLFSKIVGPTGHVIAWVPQELAGFKTDPVGTARKTAEEPGLGNVAVIVQPIDQATLSPASLDLVWTFENYHDLHDSFMHGASVSAFDLSIFRALKPKGTFVIGDHAAAAGSGLKNTEDLHRIDPAAVKSELAAAGFTFAGETPALANPDDPHTAAVFDSALRGHTDRFVFKFAKPAS